ncbi:hypothetical protein HS1genome_0808 [Sulfodiicoccus acidiphilus]|uniref:Divalent metal cation transporter n=1 Tax=Sulfodiicoccus acidiphilus TaxID=1670455 RepID=A0A348B2L7_9CREN|nr:NRAMP family divalent metal transporter [Sulfodiicoccus acidiphilus]BBD72419.1 hypothetical protein HS1genome_0808 [Sulfodiicoccus acidiphilus]GGT97266.1 hypothetical protein GCM10007116_13480 [Sulfodiicoccus acidiphilus]
MSRKYHTVLRFFGPAWLVMMADMDASSTIGAAQTGVEFRYGLIWFLLLLTIPLFIVQEVSGRIGVATSKGLGELVRERYGPKVAYLTAIPMALTDVVTYAIEYAGGAIGFEMLGVPPMVSLPVIYILHLLIVTKRKYAEAEKVLLGVSGLLILGFTVALLERGLEHYSPILFSASPKFLLILAVNVGAVVMPFMLFFQASATADKINTIGELRNESKEKLLKLMRWETLVGALVTELLMVVVEMVSSGLPQTTNFASARVLSQLLSSVAGKYSPLLFGVGLIGAAFLALVAISMGSAWGVVEAIGVTRDKSYWIYVIESLPALIAVTLIPSEQLVNAVLYLLVVFVFVLIGPLLTMGIVSRDKGVMKEYASSKGLELAYWASAIFLISFGLLALAASL